MTDLELIDAIDRMRGHSEEGQWFEFKENRFDSEELGEALSGMYNGALTKGESYGFVVYGIQDGTHEPKGTTLHSEELKVGNEGIVFWLSKNFDFRPIEMQSLTYHGKHLIVFCVHVNPTLPLPFKSQYFYRVGGAIVNITRKLHLMAELFAKSKNNKPFESGIADEQLKADEILMLLDAGVYFELKELEKPKGKDEIIRIFVREGFIVPQEHLYAITNIGALLFAKRLGHFDNLKGRRIRVVEYTGLTKEEGITHQGEHGYAIGLTSLLKWLKERLPLQPERLIGARQLRLPCYPDRALREFIANALIHQDFSVHGISPTVSIFDDRLEIRNAGIPELSTERWIDEEKSRNEKLAEKMNELTLCERRGSGVDKALLQIELCHLPAPKFVEGEFSTTVILFGPQKFTSMDKNDRIRICYQHTSLQVVYNKKANNTSLRERLDLRKEQHAIASGIFADTIESGKIRIADPTASAKFRTYIPYWYDSH